MSTLVLCIDRDNDLGDKAHLISPIIGRKDCVGAAVALGTADPEDSDVNSIFSAINVFDEFRTHNQPAEVALICGDRNVGLVSDKILATQLDSVLRETGAKSVVLVSDGAEDEHIFPIVASRIHIDSVKRVVVKQAQNLESNFYLMTKFLKEEKVLRNFVTPVALLAMVLGFVALLAIFAGFPDISWPAMLVTLGLYGMLKVTHLVDPMVNTLKGLRQAVVEGSYVLLTVLLVAFVIILSGVINSSEEAFVNLGSQNPLEMTMLFFYTMLWYFVSAIIVGTLGKFLNDLITKGEIHYQILTMFLPVIASGFMLAGVTQLLTSPLLLNYTGIYDSNAQVFLNLVMGFFVAVTGMYIYVYVRDTILKGTGTKSSDWRK